MNDKDKKQMCTFIVHKAHLKVNEGINKQETYRSRIRNSIYSIWIMPAAIKGIIK